MPHKWESHHINERKADNRPENLVICQSRRLHRFLHVFPDLLSVCTWLGATGKSVRLFVNFEPEGKRYCLKCRHMKDCELFGAESRNVTGRKSICAECIGSTNKQVRREYRKTHPPRKPVHEPMPGEKNNAAKLTEKAVIAMRAAYTNGDTQTALGIKYGVSQSTVWLIVHRKKWKHI
jgi:hypothetical protein